MRRWEVVPYNSRDWADLDPIRVRRYWSEASARRAAHALNRFCESSDFVHRYRVKDRSRSPGACTHG